MAGAQDRRDAVESRPDSPPSQGALRPRRPDGPSTFVVVKTATCQWCQVALQFLETLQENRGGFEIKVLDANEDPEAFRQVARRTRRTSVPQIFLDGGFVGGWTELVHAAKSGKLDAYLDGKAW